MESTVDPSPNLGHHAAEHFPSSRVPGSYMHTGNNGTISIDGTALVSVASLNIHCYAYNYTGFVRYGNYKHPFGLACILSNGGASYKRMFVGHRHAGELWTDILGQRNEAVLINNCGYGVFPVAAMSVSAWVSSQAEGRNGINRSL